MILLREIQAQDKDLDALEKFSQVPGMFNLTADREANREKIKRSLDSFADRLPNKSDCKYVFVAEDLDTGKIVGTSMIAAQHGTTEAPHFYFEVGTEKRFSDTINTGFIHGTLKLKYDTNGPSELGGLVMDPDFRNSDARLGRQISFVRFLYLALHKNRFKRKLIAELLPPLNQKGQSPLWEAIGRRFTSMDYWEADQLCSKNKEFIFSLFPTGKIYTTFLTGEARNAIGKVGKSTEPVQHMLEKIGFEYKNQVDPFDGGPHMWADVDSILPIKKQVNAPLKFEEVDRGAAGEPGLVTGARGPAGGFRAMHIVARVHAGTIVTSSGERADLQRALGLAEGDSVSFMPYY